MQSNCSVCSAVRAPYDLRVNVTVHCAPEPETQGGDVLPDGKWMRCKEPRMLKAIPDHGSAVQRFLTEGMTSYVGGIPTSEDQVSPFGETHLKEYIVLNDSARATATHPGTNVHAYCITKAVSPRTL
jgi:hypothetical protein